MFEVENGLELPGTFTFEWRAILGPADKALTFAERDRPAKKIFSGRRDILRGLQNGQGVSLGDTWGSEDSAGGVNSESLL